MLNSLEEKARLRTMTIMDAAMKLVKEFDVRRDDAIKAMESETDDIRADKFHIRKPTYQEAVEQAYESICGWLRTGDDYSVRLEWGDVCRFAMGHRKACVWAVLTAKARQVSADSSASQA